MKKQKNECDICLEILGVILGTIGALLLFAVINWGLNRVSNDDLEYLKNKIQSVSNVEYNDYMDLAARVGALEYQNKIGKLEKKCNK